jgi:hypothetical protein
MIKGKSKVKRQKSKGKSISVASYSPEGVMPKPAGRRPSLVKKGSFLVHTGEIPTSYDILKAIDEDREERMRKAWGL